MKKFRSYALLLAAILLLAGCSGKSETPQEEPAPAPETAETPDSDTEQAEAPESSDASITVTDMSGREITLAEPATRVVALTASDCEILYMLGAGDTLVGRGEYCDWPQEVTQVQSVQSGADTNIEQIISLEPQILLMSTMAQTEEQIAALENAGIQVVVSDAQDIAGVYDAITLIGAVMGLDEKAQTIISDMQATFANIQKEASADGQKSIYFEVSPLEYGLWAAGSDTFMNEVAQMVGLTNIFEDISGWGEVSEEQVIERNPDYILTVTMYFGDGPTPEEELLSRAGWDNITAIKEGNILNLQNNELSRPGPRLAEGAQALFDFVYQN